MTHLLDSLRVPPPEVSISEVKEIAQNIFGLAGDIKILGGERDCNYRLKSDQGDYLIKIANTAEPDQLLDMQCQALAHIQARDPSLPVSNLITTIEGKNWGTCKLKSGVDMRVRGFNFMPGIQFDHAPEDSRLMLDLGNKLAKMNLALRGFFHPAAQHPLGWNIQCFDQLKGLEIFIGDDEVKQQILEVMTRFETEVKPNLAGCRTQVIHNDVSFHNTVVDPDNPTVISGIFDFGDMIHAPLIQDLATTTSEIGAGCIDSLAQCAEIVSGFHAVSPLEDIEFKLLPDLMATRLAMGIMIDAWSSSEAQWNDDREYLIGWHEKSIAMLEIIQTTGPKQIETLFRNVCGVHVSGAIHGNNSNHLDDQFRRRQQYLGNARHFAYDEPVHVVRSKGVWLYDTNGNAFLDAYNNVPHAGHCHPRIVDAIARQTATLNTNTRYLYDVITQYAERLTATLPDGLDCCYFVSSGSEANDLAWRLSKSWTGNQGGLVLENAYHGITEATDHLTPYSHDGSKKSQEFIAAFPGPNDYRGPWKRDDPNRGPKYAEYCRTAIAQLSDHGHKPASFIMDMIMSSSGIFTSPPDYLEAVYKIARDAGALCIADEVQSGFGRTGKHMWGFQFGDISPDIVTFGKPIAGGYPMGLVVTTREISQKFEATHEFFSTTGGNPVACAAALAMLDVIEDENLMVNANDVGGNLINGLQSLMEHHSIIGDVRGSGLFIGVELVNDRQTQEPAPEKATWVANQMKRQGVLIGIDGIHNNVLKIRPPMVFNNDHVKILVEKLAYALSREHLN